MMNARFYFFLLCCLLIGACSPVKKLVDEGDRLKESGSYEESANYYYNALLKAPGNKRAQEGLKQSAQQVLNDKFTQFSKLVLANKIEEAIGQYKNAEKYANNAKSVGVTLDWPTEYDEVYADIRSEYVLTLYDDALRLLKEKKFDAAEKQFQQMAEYDPAYKDLTILRLNTVLEPLYQRGVQQLAAGKYKDAYNSFDRLLELDDHYKDASEQRQLAKEKATISLGVFPVLNNTGKTGEERLLNQYLAEDLSKKNTNAYVRVSKSAEFHANLQSRGWDRITDATKAAEAGRNFDYRYVLLVQLLSADEKVTPFMKAEREAYEAFSEGIRNPITGTYNYITKFRKTKYDDTYEARKLTYRVAYQLISSADGRILYSDESVIEKSDEQHLLTFKGNINNLYKELPSGNYMPPPDEAWHEQFNASRRSLLSREDLGKEISIQVAEKIATSVLPRLK